MLYPYTPSAPDNLRESQSQSQRERERERERERKSMCCQKLRLAPSAPELCARACACVCVCERASAAVRVSSCEFLTRITHGCVDSPRCPMLGIRAYPLLGTAVTDTNHTWTLFLSPSHSMTNSLELTNSRTHELIHQVRTVRAPHLLTRHMDTSYMWTTRRGPYWTAEVLN